MVVAEASGTLIYKVRSSMGVRYDPDFEMSLAQALLQCPPLLVFVNLQSRAVIQSNYEWPGGESTVLRNCFRQSVLQTLYLQLYLNLTLQYPLPADN